MLRNINSVPLSTTLHETRFPQGQLDPWPLRLRSEGESWVTVGSGGSRIPLLEWERGGLHLFISKTPFWQNAVETLRRHVQSLSKCSADFSKPRNLWKHSSAQLVLMKSFLFVHLPYTRTRLTGLINLPLPFNESIGHCAVNGFANSMIWRQEGIDLIVLVFSVWQDGAGPTVSQQIGASMNCSPFGRVLKNIQEHNLWPWPPAATATGSLAATC